MAGAGTEALATSLREGPQELRPPLTGGQHPVPCAGTGYPPARRRLDELLFVEAENVRAAPTNAIISATNATTKPTNATAAPREIVHCW